MILGLVGVKTEIQNLVILSYSGLSFFKRLNTGSPIQLTRVSTSIVCHLENDLG